MPELWLKTADAAEHLAVSRSYLKRCRIEYDGGFLLPRKHYILGASRTASIFWNVDAVREAFHERGHQSAALMRSLLILWAQKNDSNPFWA